MVVFNRDDFNRDLFLRINGLIVDYGLVEEGDLIAVALSGGKDSVLTLYALNYYQQVLDFDLVAVCVDEGIEGYRSYGVESAIKNAEKLGVNCVVRSFSDFFDFSLDDIYDNFKSPCIPCGVFRRNILNRVSFEMGADKMATGHNLDDELQSFLMSFARGDVIKFSKFTPKLDVIHEKLVPRIKPLWNTPEKDVGRWVILNDIDVHFDECPYSRFSLRSKIKNFLNVHEDEYPGLKSNIMESFKKMLNFQSDFKSTLYECEICGQPTSAHVCKACEMNDLIRSLGR